LPIISEGAREEGDDAVTLSLLELNQFVLHRIPDQLPNRVKAEFHHDPSPVGFDCRNGYAHERSDFLVTLSLSEESNNFTFSLAQGISSEG
jgi:hypothetical protein